MIEVIQNFNNKIEEFLKLNHSSYDKNLINLYVASRMLYDVWVFVIKNRTDKREDVLLNDEITRLGSNIGELEKYLPKEVLEPLEPFIILPNGCIVESQPSIEKDLPGTGYSKNINRK